eukprot:5396245-Ditylum_brightwellii.AAC.2
MSAKDTKERERDLIVDYWVSSSFENVENELIHRQKSNRPVTGFNFPLLNLKCVVVSFMADHGSETFHVALGVNASEGDGQPKPIKIAHLLAKESHDVLLNTIAPGIHKGILQLQCAAVVIIKIMMILNLPLYLAKLSFILTPIFSNK